MSAEGWMDTWFRAYRCREADELIKASPNAFILLYVIARRAQRTGSFNRHNLKPGEALVGDFREYGMTEQHYRTAKRQLEKWNFATFKATSKGTVATLINTRVFDVNLESCNDQDNEQVTSSQRTPNEQPTTTNNGKKENNVIMERKGEPSLSTFPPEVQFWNSNCGQLPKVISFSSGRRRHLDSRRREPFWVENYQAAVRRMAVSSFCNGRNDRGWRADFDFLIESPDNITKVMEGKYDDRQNHTRRSQIVADPKATF